MGNWADDATREEDLDWALADRSSLRTLVFVNWKVEVDASIQQGINLFKASNPRSQANQV